MAIHAQMQLDQSERLAGGDDAIVDRNVAMTHAPTTRFSLAHFNGKNHVLQHRRIRSEDNLRMLLQGLPVEFSQKPEAAKVHTDQLHVSIDESPCLAQQRA